MTQNERIKLFLMMHSTGLTQGEAARWMPQVLRLSERVRELEAAGLAINHVPERHKDGKHTRYYYAGEQQIRMAI